MNAQERAARASRLKELMQHDDVKDALASVEQDLIAEWRKCHAADERENLWFTLKAFDRLKTRLEAWSQSDITALAKGR